MSTKQPKKAQNHSKNKYSITNLRALRDSYKSRRVWNGMNVFKAIKDELINAYRAWADLPTSEDYLDFIDFYGIPYRTFQDHYLQDPEMKEVHEEVKLKLGARLQKIARRPLEHKANADTYTRTLHWYHPDWRRNYDENRELKIKKLEMEKEKLKQEKKNLEAQIAFYGMGMKQSNDKKDIPG